MMMMMMMAVRGCSFPLYSTLFSKSVLFDLFACNVTKRDILLYEFAFLR